MKIKTYRISKSLANRITKLPTFRASRYVFKQLERSNREKLNHLKFDDVAIVADKKKDKCGKIRIKH